MWSDGTAVDYRNWAAGEPNSWGGREHYAEFVPQSSQWNDGGVRGGHALAGFVCGPADLSQAKFVRVESSLTVAVAIEAIPAGSAARSTFDMVRSRICSTATIDSLPHCCTELQNLERCRAQLAPWACQCLIALQCATAGLQAGDGI